MKRFLKDNGLSITIETYFYIADYVDVTFNLQTGKYYLNRKQNNSL